MTIPRSQAADQRYYGVVEAIVVEVDDPEKEGRVKIKYPWFDDRTVTEWCRVRQLYAGNGYGTFFIPEPGDEVLVSFIHGDMRLPIILGGLYNGQDKPPSHRSRDKDEKLIRTREGHQLLFNDTRDQHQVVLQTAAGHSADFNDKQEQIAVASSGGHQVLLDDKNKKVEITTSGGHQVLIDARGRKITVATAGGQKVTLDANAGTVTIEGASLVVKASDIKLGGVTAFQPLVLGTAFMTLFNTHFHASSVPGTPTSPPIVPMTPAQLSTTSKTS